VHLIQLLFRLIVYLFISVRCAFREKQMAPLQHNRRRCRHVIAVEASTEQRRYQGGTAANKSKRHDITKALSYDIYVTFDTGGVRTIP